MQIFSLYKVCLNYEDCFEICKQIKHVLYIIKEPIISYTKILT